MHSTFDKSSINSALRLRSSKNLVYKSRHPCTGTRTKAVTDITRFSTAWREVRSSAFNAFPEFLCIRCGSNKRPYPKMSFHWLKQTKKINFKFSWVNAGKLHTQMKKVQILPQKASKTNKKTAQKCLLWDTNMHLQEQFNQKVKLRQTYKEGNKVSQSRSVILQSQNRVDTLQKHCILRYPFPVMKPVLRRELAFWLQNYLDKATPVNYCAIQNNLNSFV